VRCVYVMHGISTRSILRFFDFKLKYALSLSHSATNAAPISELDKLRAEELLTHVADGTANIGKTAMKDEEVAVLKSMKVDMEEAHQAALETIKPSLSKVCCWHPRVLSLVCVCVCVCVWGGGGCGESNGVADR
jgi:hypothetical protein